jgi:hypothetical protein
MLSGVECSGLESAGLLVVGLGYRWFAGAEG